MRAMANNTLRAPPDIANGTALTQCKARHRHHGFLPVRRIVMVLWTRVQ
jgi:hypothetical protein